MDYSRARSPNSGAPTHAISRPASGGEGQGGAVMPLASPGTFVRELAVGLVAAFVDALQAFRDHGLQFPDLVLLLGVFRIHQLFCWDVKR